LLLPSFWWQKCCRAFTLKGARAGTGACPYGDVDMTFNSGIHRRRSIRLQGYDYSRAGAYFITICTQNRECMFGAIVDGKMVMNHAGDMIQTVWDEIPFHYAGIDIDEFIVMPNHIHGIIIIGNTETLSLPDVVHRFKTMATKRYADGVKQKRGASFPGRLWQRNYWEHIIRNGMELNRIREYINTNPTQWESDRLNPVEDETASRPPPWKRQKPG
jgi:putative transposase